MTLKSYIHLNSSKSNIKIQEKLLSNSYTQSSLTHFKNQYHRLFSTIVNKTTNIYSNIFNLSQKLDNQTKYLLSNQKQILIVGSIRFSKMYSSSSKYEQLIKDIKLMRKGSKNVVGKSFTSANHELVRFTVNDRSHPRSKEIYAELDRLAVELIEDGYKFDSSCISREIRKGETVVSVLSSHSEKLALAFNLIEKPAPSFIQITNNLRLCRDCHEYMKRVAKLRQCVIVIRDANRIHRFSINGECSCKDYF